jgi:hypothetical protein
MATTAHRTLRNGCICLHQSPVRLCPDLRHPRHPQLPRSSAWRRQLRVPSPRPIRLILQQIATRSVLEGAAARGDFTPHEIILARFALNDSRDLPINTAHFIKGGLPCLIPSPASPRPCRRPRLQPHYRGPTGRIRLLQPLLRLLLPRRHTPLRATRSPSLRTQLAK